MKKLIIYQVDSFTREKFKGNPAGVVLNADGLNDEQMQAIARELNNSETAFLFKAESNDCDCVIRYFTPKAEVPTCGHATIAAMYVKAIEENLGPCSLRLKTNIGVLPVEVVRQATDYRIVMTQGEFELSQNLSNEIVNKIIAALGLDWIDLDPRCPVQIASAGHAKVMIGIQSRDKLNRLSPNYTKLAELSHQIKCNGYFVFTFDSDIPDILTYGRMFAPAIGVNEDPVTGNANGPLGGYLVSNKLVDYTSILEFSARQGEIINRLGEMKVRVLIENDLPASIQIEGEAIIVFKTELQV